MDSKITLLAVTGLTPQVITETLYALHKQNQPMPQEIHILTSAEGYQRAKLTLLNDGWLARFYSDYQLPPCAFDEKNIHRLTQADGTDLEDIRTQLDNQAMADGITEWMRRLTTESRTALHVSIAGGRKTMGFYAGYALSLYGRPQDRLSHVLVSADFESHPQFYYPTPYSQVIYGNDPTRKPLDTQQAEVMLADIPFVRLRHGLDEAFLQGKSSFSQTVAKAQQALSPARIEIDVKNRLLIVHDTAIKLMPADLAFYLWLLNRQETGKPAPTYPSDGAPEQEYAAEYLGFYHSINGELGGQDRTTQSLQQGMTKTFFEQRKSRINATLKQSLSIAAPVYAIHAEGKRLRTCYRINISRHQINYLTGD